MFAEIPNLPTKLAGGCAGGASRGGPGERSPPGKTRMINLLYLLCLRAGRGSLGGERGAVTSPG
eukprot:13559811-Alexandrium_andersonii.AAC.1